jgi:hypothetical protein
MGVPQTGTRLSQMLHQSPRSLRSACQFLRPRVVLHRSLKRTGHA